MKRIFLILFVAGLMTTSFTSCREQSTADKVEEAAEDVGDEVEDAADDLDAD
ncbi:hypothetical protein [Croceiramulus getboli]|nr:hypothetical protein P8624_00970 [Flavobacteriaceae bacterium YJPT1-3]